MTEFTRRTLISLLGAAGVAPAVLPSFAQGVSNRKFIFVFLRGALDGLSALAPDDRQLISLRPNLIAEPSAYFDLSNGFRLHPAMPGANALYAAGELGFVHSAAPPYRVRSHFDAQDMFETMGRQDVRDGWLNRVVRELRGQGVAVDHSLPLALQGPGETFNWSPPVFGEAPPDVLDRLAALYEDIPAFSEALAVARGAMGMADSGGSARRFGRDYVMSMEIAGRLMRQPGGPGICMLSFGGWDSHAGQVRDHQRRLAALDDAIVALKAAMGPEWQQTCVVMCSEFGRTVRENGTGGTDHGTGGLVILAGGAVRGGKVHGDWPGLKPAQLLEGRDLAPANPVTGILKGVIRDHLGIDRSTLEARIFPDGVRPMDGLIAT